MTSSREPPPELGGGDTFQYTGKQSDNHLWIVVSDPLQNESRVLVVNLTTCRQRSDRACLIQPGDHPFVTALTCVQYLACREVKLGILEEWLDVGQIVKREPVTQILLSRIRQGAVNSPHTPLGVKTLLLDQGLAEP